MLRAYRVNGLVNYNSLTIELQQKGYKWVDGDNMNTVAEDMIQALSEPDTFLVANSKTLLCTIHNSKSLSEEAIMQKQKVKFYNYEGG